MTDLEQLAAFFRTIMPFVMLLYVLGGLLAYFGTGKYRFERNRKERFEKFLVLFIPTLLVVGFLIDRSPPIAFVDVAGFTLISTTVAAMFAYYFMKRGTYASRRRLYLAKLKVHKEHLKLAMLDKSLSEAAIKAAPPSAPNIELLHKSLCMSIDNEELQPNLAAAEEYKMIALEILKEVPTDEAADKLVKNFRLFVKSLPSHYTYKKGNFSINQFPIVAGGSLDPQTIDAIFWTALWAPGAFPKYFTTSLTRIEGDKTANDWINVKAYRAKKPEAFLNVIAMSPFSALARSMVPFINPPMDTRFEHTWILGPQGSGKTQLLQTLIAEDLKADCSVMVIDSQGDLIKNLSSLRSIQDRIVLIEPGEVALNPFDLKGEQAVDLLTYVFGALGEGAEMTPKQSALYRYSIRLLQEIPEATPITFIELLQPNGIAPYTQYLKNLSPPAQLFFNNQFDDPKQFAQTKQEVAWRLMLLLENPTFERMFCAPRTKFNLFNELNANKVILVDTNQDLLGEDRSALFGRFFISLLLLASQQRASQAREERRPTFVYIDEAHEYLSDDKATQILDQARKMKIGMTLANQRSTQVTNGNALDALMTTSTKYIHTDNPRDTHLLSPMMKVTPAFLDGLEKMVFAMYVRNTTPEAYGVKVPFLVVENMEHVDIGPLRARMKEQYGPDDTPRRPPPKMDPPPSTNPTEW